MINAKRMFILVFTCLFSLSINNVYAQNHDSLTIHSYYLDVNNHLSNISGDHIALIKIADYDGNNYHVLEKYSKLVTINKDMTASEQNGVATKLMDYIQKNNIRLFLGKRFAEFARERKTAYRKSFLIQRVTYQFPDIIIIFNYKYSIHLLCLPATNYTTYVRQNQAL